MLPRLFVLRNITVAIIIALIATTIIALAGADEIVYVEMLRSDDGYISYQMAGTIIADAVEVRFETVHSIQIAKFEATGGTVHFSAVTTFNDIVMNVSARAQSGEAWRDVPVTLMSSIHSTPTSWATVTLRPLPTRTPVATPEPTPMPGRDMGCPDYVECIYLPVIKNG